MASITVRNLDPRTHAKLRGLAAANGRSMEAEVRALLDQAVADPGQSMIHALMQIGLRHGGVDLDLPARETFPERSVDLQ